MTVAKRLQKTYASFEIGTLWTRSTALGRGAADGKSSIP
jgi:hypothetical protein